MKILFFGGIVVVRRRWDAVRFGLRDELEPFFSSTVNECDYANILRDDITPDLLGGMSNGGAKDTLRERVCWPRACH
jgi:hypothetical protein